AAVVLLAFASDYLDGVIARRVGVATPALRHFDSRADLVFYATAAWTVWMRRPDVARSVAIPALVVIGLDVLRYVFDFAKFGRDAAYHAWLEGMGAVAGTGVDSTAGLWDHPAVRADRRMAWYRCSARRVFDLDDFATLD